MDQKTLPKKEASQPPSLIRLLEPVLLTFLPVFFAFIWGNTSFAESFGDSIPKGDETRDPYLEKLFAQEFQFETIRIIVTKAEEKYVVVKAKQNITDEIKNRYEKGDAPQKRIVIAYLPN